MSESVSAFFSKIPVALFTIVLTLIGQLVVGISWLDSRFAAQERELAILNERQTVMTKQLEGLTTIVQLNSRALQQNYREQQK